jgi:hypothetical protein
LARQIATIVGFLLHCNKKTLSGCFFPYNSSDAALQHSPVKQFRAALIPVTLLLENFYVDR